MQEEQTNRLGRFLFRTALLLTLVFLLVPGCDQAGAGGNDEENGVEPGEATTDCGGPYRALVDDPTVTLDGSGSRLPADGATFRWLPGDSTGAMQTREPTVEHTYPEVAAVYTVSLTLIDAAGKPLGEPAETSCRVRERPLASFEPPSDVVMETPAVFDASASSDVDGLGAITEYRWDFNYDGETFEAETTTSQVTTVYTFQVFGNQTVALVVVNDDGFESEVATESVAVDATEGAEVHLR